MCFYRFYYLILGETRMWTLWLYNWNVQLIHLYSRLCFFLHTDEQGKVNEDGWCGTHWWKGKCEKVQNFSAFVFLSFPPQIV